MKYYLTTKHIESYDAAKKMGYASEFLNDIYHHSGQEVLLDEYTGVAGYTRIRLASGRNFMSGTDQWHHKLSKLAIIEERSPSHLPDSLFEV